MAETIEIGVISDTHGKLPGAVFKAFEGVAGIVHCGDVCDLSILDELAIIAPVWAVGGNVDASGDRRLPPARVEKCGDVTIAVTHGHLSPGWGAERVQGLPECSPVASPTSSAMAIRIVTRRNGLAAC